MGPYDINMKKALDRSWKNHVAITDNKVQFLATGHDPLTEDTLCFLLDLALCSLLTYLPEIVIFRVSFHNKGKGCTCMLILTR